MTYRLVFSAAAFRDIVVRLAASPGRRLVCSVGVSRLAGSFEFLVHRISADGATPLIVRGVTRPGGFDEALRAEAPLDSGVFLALGTGTAAGSLAGLHFTAGVGDSLDEIAVVAPGMPVIRMDPPLEPNAGASPIWSRTIGALGEHVWRRLTSLRFAVVGCGRSGQLVAMALSRLGVQRLTLLDPDRLEAHNLGEGDGVGAADVGRSKVDTLGAFIAQQGASTAPEITAVAESIFSLSSLVAIKTADFLICSVDNALARIATDFLAKLYLKPIVDIGTGILWQGSMRMGMDVRLVLPGRCLLCFGGVAGLEEGRRQLASGVAAAPLGDWRRQRAGSLRSLNQVATGFALRLIEEFVQGRLRESAWLQMEVQESGIPVLEHHSSPASPGCPFCRITGLGDDGVHLLPSVIA